MALLMRAGVLVGLASSVFSQKLPTPTGPFQVGTTSVSIVDRNSVDLADPKPEKFRELNIQFWYPSQKKEEKQDFAPYFPNSALAPVLIKDEYNSQPPSVIQTLTELRTSAILDGRVRKGGAKYPLLIFSPGFGEPRSNYTALAQQLASIGYVVITVDHPYGGFTAFPDGRVLSTTNDRRNENPDIFEILVEEWARDASYLVNQLKSKESFGISPVKEVVKLINFSKIGMLGHSLGGAAALETCRTDIRFSACADLDGAPFGKVKGTGVRKPTLVFRSRPIYSDQDLAKRGRTRDQWEAMGREVNAAWRSIISKDDKIPIYIIHVAGAGHMSFSDAPFTMPDTISRFGGRIIDAEVCFRITSRYLAAFFGTFLKNKSTSLFSKATSTFTEVKIEQLSGGHRQNKK